MKIKAVLAALALAVMPLSTLSAQKYDGIIDKTVALVGNSMILLSQIESEVQMMQFQGYVSDRNLRCEVLENMMVSKLFYTQAQLDSLAVNPDMVDAALEDRVNNILSQLVERSRLRNISASRSISCVRSGGRLSWSRIWLRKCSGKWPARLRR